MDHDTQVDLARAEALIAAAMEILVSEAGELAGAAIGQQLVEDYARHHARPSQPAGAGQDAIHH